ncbi:30S ribosomal protein S6 [bacterium]|nr:30S ribosomal protein S6 [bacterium]
MSFYEVMVVFNSQVSSADVDNSIGKIKEIISSNEGEILFCNPFGKKQMCYEIKGCKEGNYVCLGISAPPTISVLIDKYCKIADEIIRHMIIKKKSISVQQSPAVSTEEAKEEAGEQEKQAETSNLPAEENVDAVDAKEKGKNELEGEKNGRQG